jgi:hypothetical protein
MIRWTPLLLLLPVPAPAAWPAEVVITDLTTHRGAPVAPEIAARGHDQVIRGLGVAVANKPVHPARTLGSAGTDVSFGLTATLLATEPDDDGNPSGWALTTRQTGVGLMIPTMTVRKGLPGSVEVGGSAGWIGSSRQGVLGAFVRAAPLEGMEPAPDLSFQLGYAGYVGNPDLLLGALDASASIGGSIPFGGDGDEVKQARISPFAGGGLLVVHARTIVDAATQAAIWGPDRDGDPSRTRPTPIPQLHAGVHITNNTALVRLAGTWSPGVAPSLHFGLGFMF